VAVHPPKLAECLGLLVSAKVALSLDPSLYTSKTVTRQIGQLNEAARLLKAYLSDLARSQEP
jgi:HAMP domain-containing protein